MSTNVNERKHRIPFSQRIFWSIFFIFLAFSVCFLIFQYEREKEFAQEKLNNVLVNYNYQLYSLCEKSENIPLTVQHFMGHIPQKDLRVTIIDPEGNVLFDNSGTDEFTNHNDRSEVRRARLHQEGFSIRSSQSTGKRYFYSASLIDGHIYRCALHYDPYVEDILTVNKDFIYFMSLITLIFFMALTRFTFSIGQTIAKLRDFALKVEKERLPDDDDLFPNDELGDISRHIVLLYHKQQKAKNALSIEREKIIKHFQYSKEGFAMFTGKGEEILSNNLFIQFVNVISDKQIQLVENAIKIPELAPIRAFLETHIQQATVTRKVLRESVTIDKNGMIFLIECILFLDNSFELSIHDISRQEEESRMKRQLTQNVSHELKTPVTSIQGYLETILSNPDLNAEKRQYFLDRCYSQTTRLTGLLRDISVLNRLDEATEMFDRTEVNITKLISEIIKECSKEMEEKGITSKIILPNEPIVKGNYSLLYSIFRNLYDNAIAYAGEHITINVNCYKEDPKYYYFSFSDNGVGIPEEHINRIFERFYRVDKGRSRKIGGTGLGLSIVKNGVNFHKGQIYAKSSLGKGVTFFFTIKKD